MKQVEISESTSKYPKKWEYHIKITHPFRDGYCQSLVANCSAGCSRCINAI